MSLSNHRPRQLQIKVSPRLYKLKKVLKKLLKVTMMKVAQISRSVVRKKEVNTAMRIKAAKTKPFLKKTPWYKANKRSKTKKTKFNQTKMMMTTMIVMMTLTTAILTRQLTWMIISPKKRSISSSVWKKKRERLNSNISQPKQFQITKNLKLRLRKTKSF